MVKDKRPWGQLVDLVKLTLKEEGPATAADLAQRLGATRYDVHAAASKLMKDRPRAGPRCVYVKAWIYDAEGQRNYPRPLYALGVKPDAPRPKADQNAVKRRYWARRKARLMNADIFRVGGESSPLMRKGQREATT